MNSPTAKRKYIPRTFLRQWLERDDFKPWLQRVFNDDSKFHCSACCKNYMINSGLSEIKNHFGTKSHAENVSKLSERNSAAFDDFDVSDSPENILEKIQIAEIALCAFFVEHNIPFHISAYLIGLLKVIFPDSYIASKLTLSRLKCNKIITNVLSKVEVSRIIESARHHKFSIFVDESTDISNVKWLTFLIKYVNSETSAAFTELLELLKLDAIDCSAEGLFSAFEKALHKKQIPVQNVIGLTCDNASVMIGRFSSFCSKLKTMCPSLITVNCICHSAALVSSKACSEIPSYIEKFIRNLTVYINSSAKRSVNFANFQEFVNNK